jgi:hypothetical protein
MRQLSILKKAYEKWARHVQEIGRLLGRQFGMMRHESDRVAFCQLGKESAQQSNCRSGENHRLVRRAFESNDTGFTLACSDDSKQAPARISGKCRHLLGGLNGLWAQAQYSGHGDPPLQRILI